MRVHGTLLFNAQVNYTRQNQITRGSRMVIKDLLKLKGIWIMTNAFNLAIKVEKQINRYFVRPHNKYK